MQGDYGERYACTVNDVTFVMLGWKQTDRSEEIGASVAFLEQQLTASTASQKWCVFAWPPFVRRAGLHRE